MKKETRWGILCAAIIAAVIALDQIAKRAVMARMALDTSIDLIPGVLRLTYIRNAGAAFGMMKNTRWLFLVVSTVVIIVFMYVLWRYRGQSALLNLSVALVEGGGISNMVDRLFYGDAFGKGTVVDFLDFCAFPNLWRWIFNVADAAVVVGTCLLVLYLILEIIKEGEAKSGENAAPNGGGSER